MIKDGHFALAERLSGRHSFIPIAISQKLNLVGPAQWDGRYLAVGSGNHGYSIIYQFAVSGRRLLVWV
jgi:hypothetical protein